MCISGGYVFSVGAGSQELCVCVWIQEWGSTSWPRISSSVQLEADALSMANNVFLLREWPVFGIPDDPHWELAHEGKWFWKEGGDHVQRNCASFRITVVLERPCLGLTSCTEL